MCAIASAMLFKKLKDNGIIVKLASNNKHCFLLTEDDFVVDVTATQFYFKDKVTIETLTYMQCHCSWAYCIDKLHDDMLSLRTWQLESGWPYHQVVKYMDSVT